jgi:hypothetical protein
MAKTQLPAFMQEHAGLGRLGVGDVEMPRLKLLQAPSPELTEFNNAKQGEFWHSLIAFAQFTSTGALFCGVRGRRAAAFLLEPTTASIGRPPIPSLPLSSRAATK